MSKLNELFLDLGRVVVTLGVIALLCLAMQRSHHLKQAVKLALLGLWGLLTVGVTAWVVIGLLQQGDTGRALYVGLGGAVLAYPWVKFGLPFMLELINSQRR